MHNLPYNVNLNTIDVLKQLCLSNNQIGEIKGLLKVLPNPKLVLSLITLGESKDSSAIENIVTTYDEIFKELVSKVSFGGKPKEVVNYQNAIEKGLQLVQENGYLNTNTLIAIHEIIEQNSGGIRKLPGTVILNENTKEILHVPPQSEAEIRDYLANLDWFINQESEYDPLVNVALVHFQFESIHPFYDGNGRTGRILNILYLVLKEKIQEPILYLSKYIIEHKTEYYTLLRKCNQDITFIHEFVLFMLKAIEETARNTIELIMNINESIEMAKVHMKSKLPDIYRAEIVEHLFSYLYTKNEFFRESLGISRATATKYLKALEKEGFVISEQLGKEVIYKNVFLFRLLHD